MFRFLLYAIITLAFFTPFSVLAAGKTRIAVMDLRADGIPATTARTISNIIRTDLVNIGLFTVIERGQMDTILNEQGFQQTGCTDQECAVKIGQLLSASKMLIGEVGPMDKGLVITVRIVDVEKGVSELAEREVAESEAMVKRAVSNLINRLADKIKSAESETRAAAIRTKTGYYLRSIVPGWGQYYGGNKGEGIFFGAAFCVSAGLTSFAGYKYYTAKKSYEDLPFGTSRSEFGSKRDDYRMWAQRINIMIGVTALVYLVHWVDVLFFSDVQFSAGTGLNGKGDFSLVFAIATSYYDTRENIYNAAFAFQF